MAHALCMLDYQGYRHTLRICNIYCFSTAPIITQTHLIITLYVHCLNFLFITLTLLLQNNGES